MGKSKSYWLDTILSVFQGSYQQGEKISVFFADKLANRHYLCSEYVTNRSSLLHW